MSLRCCRIQRRAITLRINKQRPEGPTQATESQMERPQALPISKIVNHKSTNDCQCSRIDVEPRILSCRSAGAPEIRLGLIPGRTQPRWGWDIRGAGVPRVASALLRQPWAEIRIPVGDEEPSTPTGLCILARGWRNAVKPTPGQRTKKFHNPNGVAYFSPGLA